MSGLPYTTIRDAIGVNPKTDAKLVDYSPFRNHDDLTAYTVPILRTHESVALPNPSSHSKDGNRAHNYLLNHTIKPPLRGQTAASDATAIHSKSVAFATTRRPKQQAGSD